MPDTDAADQNDMRDGKNQPERRRQSVPIRERRLHGDRNRIGHGETIQKCALMKRPFPCGHDCHSRGLRKLRGPFLVEPRRSSRDAEAAIHTQPFAFQ